MPRTVDIETFGEPHAVRLRVLRHRKKPVASRHTARLISIFVGSVITCPCSHGEFLKSVGCVDTFVCELCCS